jgi:ketosteroid isomerase-like protein
MNYNGDIRAYLRAILVIPALIAGCASSSSGRAAGPARDIEVRAQLERRYAENADAFMHWDVRGVMALRAPDFHTISPDGQTNDRAAMERYTEGLLNGIKKWNALTVTIDSLRVVGDTAFAIVSQHLDRMALRTDQQVHHVETWATQREIWILSGTRWLLWRVDQIRNQRRVVDGSPG